MHFTSICSKEASSHSILQPFVYSQTIYCDSNMLDQAIGQRRKQHIKLCGFNSKRETTTTILQGPSI